MTVINSYSEIIFYILVYKEPSQKNRNDFFVTKKSIHFKIIDSALFPVNFMNQVLFEMFENDSDLTCDFYFFVPDSCLF